MDEENSSHQQNGDEGFAGSSGSADWTHQASRAWQDVVAGAVRTASEVINEQIRMGQRTAQDLNDRFYDMGSGGQNNGQFQDAWFRPWAEMTARWFEMMGSMAGARPAGAGGYGFAGAPSNGTSQPAAGTTARLVVTSRVPTTVDLDLPGRAQDLVCDPLESVDADGLALAASITTMPGGLVTLKLHVPDNQKPGTYKGVVRERQTNEQVGQITVQIDADS